MFKCGLSKGALSGHWKCAIQVPVPINVCAKM